MAAHDCHHRVGTHQQGVRLGSAGVIRSVLGRGYVGAEVTAITGAIVPPPGRGKGEWTRGVRCHFLRIADYPNSLDLEHFLSN